MAKKKSRKNRKSKKSRGMGSIVSMRTLRGLGSVEAKTLTPIVIGGGLAAAFVAIVRRALPLDTGSANNRFVVKYAPLFGAGLGIVSGVAYAMFVSKKSSDSGLAATGAILVGSSFMAQDLLALKPRGGAVVTALAGVGAIVPELGGLRGVTVLEPWTHNARPDSLGRIGAIVPELGSAGTDITLNGMSGMGNIDTSVFGRSTFHA